MTNVPSISRGSNSNALSGVTLSIEGLSISVKPPLSGMLRKFAPRSVIEKRRELAVSDISALMQPGALHIIYSADDFRSSTLARVMAGLASPRRVVAGVVLANSVPVPSALVAQQIGYIGSLHGILDEATILDNLSYALRMRCDAEENSERLFNSVLSAVNLNEFANQIAITLSTAQRLGLAIAMELVVGRCVLFIEKPLRYVTYADVGDLIGLLRNVTAYRKTNIIVTTSEVPWSLRHAASTILLLSSKTGHMVFSGPVNKLDDFITHVESQLLLPSPDDDSADELVTPATRRDGDQLALTSLPIDDTVVWWDAQDEVTRIHSIFMSSAAFVELQQSLRTHRDRIHRDAFDPVTRQDSPNAARHIALMLMHTVRFSLRRTGFLLAFIGLFAAFIVGALLSSKQSPDQRGMQNRRGLIFLVLSCAVHANILFVREDVAEQHALIHLLDNGYITLIEYVVVLFVRVAIPRLVFSVVALVAGFALESAASLAVLCGLTSFAHAMLQLWGTAIFINEAIVISMTLVYYAIAALSCGFFLSLSSVPFLSRLSILLPGYTGATVRALAGRSYGCAPTPWNASAISCYTGDAYIALQGFSEVTLAGSCVELVLISILVILAYVTTLQHLRRPQ